MPNHFHGLIHLSDRSSKNLNQLVGNGKRFLGYEIVARLKAKGDTTMLGKLSRDVSKREMAIGKLHQIFKPSFDAKLCHDLTMLETKLDYIHHNPVLGKWKLVDDWVDYQHSSAGYYYCDKPNTFLTDYREIW